MRAQDPDPNTRPLPAAVPSPPADAGTPPPAPGHDTPPAESPLPLTVDQHPSVTEDATEPAAPRPATGTLGRYELLQEVARGGMGVVYRARDRTLGRTVALKTMRAEAAEQIEKAQRFDREAKAAAQLHHPHILPIHEFGEEGGRHYYTMPFVEGGSLARHRDRLKADPRAAVALLEKVTRAVEHAHQQGVCHRDLKPSNILLDERGEPLVVDFGLAKILDSDVDLTRPGEVLGTPAYMSPEQAAGQSDRVGPASDVWALGVILYELLTGKRPFPGDSRERVRQAIIQEEPPRPRGLRTGLDRELETVVLHCLEKEPGRRYASAGALADDLGRWLHGEAVGVRPERWPARAWRWARRRPAVAVALLLAGLAAVIVPTALYVSHPDRSLDAIERDLRRGRRVVLVGQNGRPKWSRWAAGEGRIPREETFSIQSENACLLELVADPQTEWWEFSTEVRFVEGFDGQAGIYFGRDARGPFHLMANLTFNDLLPSPGPPAAPGQPDSVAVLAACVVCDNGAVAKEQLHQFPFKAARAGRHAWRSLGVKASPERFIVRWDDQSFEVAREDLDGAEQRVAGQLPGLKDVPADLRPRGGLGLQVSGVKAEFRNIVIESQTPP